MDKKELLKGDRGVGESAYRWYVSGHGDKG